MKGSKELIRDTLLKLDGTSDNDEWVDLVDRYELDCSPDHLRKLAYGFRMYRDIMGENSNETEELVKLKKERQKVSDLRNSLQRDLRKLARIEDFNEIIINECKNLPDFKLKYTSKVKLYDENKDAILLISDIHYDGQEEVIYKFNKIINYTIDKCKFNHVNKLIVCLAGDLINNEFRTTSRIENRESISKQITGVSKLISDGIYELAKNIPYICVASVVGNHSRTISDYKESMTTDNYLCLINELIELRLNDVTNVVFLDNFEGDDRFTLFKIKDKTYCLTHGDGLKGLQKNAIPTIEGYLRTNIDYLLLGHFHQIQDFMFFDKRIIINGAINNNFDYSKKKFLNTPCYQRLMILDEQGDIECTYDIKLK